MDTQNITWDERTNDENIAFDGTAKEVSEGCAVHLRNDGVEILANITEYREGQAAGEVAGYVNETDEQVISIGTSIKFEDRHIFRCAA